MGETSRFGCEAAGLLAPGSSYSPGLPIPKLRGSGVFRVSSPITVAGLWRISTAFPLKISPEFIDGVIVGLSPPLRIYPMGSI